jgi:hypothetical protein
MLLPNMSKNSDARQKKVESAVRIFQTTTSVKVLQAMTLAGFLKSDVASKTVHQAVRCCRQQNQNKVRVGGTTPTDGVIFISNDHHFWS